MNEFVASDAPPISPDPAPVTSVPSVGGPERIEFSGARPEFRRLVMRGAVLELFTLGFYRFWLATDMRSHLWSNTSVGGDALEYTGTAKELLIGFLFALAILVPIYLIYFFIGLEAERLQRFASIPLVLFFYLFARFANYRARRYRLSRTIWRGVRFWMRGSGWAFAWRAGLWALLSILTLGLTLPVSRAFLERYKMRHSHYGDCPGRFEGRGWELFKRFLPLWFMFVATLGLIILAGSTQPRVIGPIILLFLIGFPFAYAVYKAAEWRWWVAGMRFGDVRFELNFTSRQLIDLYWKMIGWSVLIFIALSAWFGAVVGIAVSNLRVTGKNLRPEDYAVVMQAPWTLLLIAAGYVIAALTFGTLVRIYLRRDVWARVTSAALIYNLASVDNVTASGQAASALGEGLADSLDIGGF
jgi:uncharacterized membrane protein YjgN (DUF898 family)